MGKIQLEGMEFFAYHGCFREEQLIGTKFVVDLDIEYETSSAEQSDHLHDTLNYQEAYRIVKKEMEIRSNLLEHVARRILEAMKKAFPSAGKTVVKISKLNPPLGGKVRQVSCVLAQ
jgi:dihydroneopterin aldolase